MPACCIAYTTDQTYLLPSLVSAIQARRHASRGSADVVIFAFNIDPRAEADFLPVCAAEDIALRVVPNDVLQGAPAMMARLFLNEFVPAQYDQYLYMDGDTQVLANLDPLLRATVPPGRFLAVNDPLTFLLPDFGAEGVKFASHTAAIGLAPRQAETYFNTGVLRINRLGWDLIGQSAWKLAREKASTFRFPDQDPLNVVGANCHVPISLGWNFPIFMRNARVESQIRPAIYHFMSNPKPWQGNFMPWGEPAARPYYDIIRTYPSLHRHLRCMTAGRRTRYYLQQRYKQVLEMLSWGYGTRRRRILNYEAEVAHAA